MPLLPGLLTPMPVPLRPRQLVAAAVFVFQLHGFSRFGCKVSKIRQFRPVGKSGLSVNFVNLYKPDGRRQDGGRDVHDGVRA